LYAQQNGFKVATTYQLVKYPHHIQLRDTCVIKPVDLCDSHGVFLIQHKKDKRTNQIITKQQISQELYHIRSQIDQEYYMHEKMFQGLIPFTGYIVEELLLDNGQIPSDYKCYVFGGTIQLIAHTSERSVIDNQQSFNSTWFTREWEPIRIPMINKNYKYKNIPKPNGFESMIHLVEAMGKKLRRHCRIDVFLINGEVYFGEFTFFCGAFLHTMVGNMLLGYHWYVNPDDYSYHDPILNKLVPSFYESSSKGVSGLF
jgi:hypothetical protein